MPLMQQQKVAQADALAAGGDSRGVLGQKQPPN